MAVLIVMENQRLPARCHVPAGFQLKRTRCPCRIKGMGILDDILGLYKASAHVAKFTLCGVRVDKRTGVLYCEGDHFLRRAHPQHATLLIMDMEVEHSAEAQAEGYLARLNPAQRHAVEHAAGGDDVAPLLVIAGAGSGKTNTLAHRVAHLIAQGANPGAILLLTFSRRAADEMARRAERIVRQLAVDRPKLAGTKLHWTGTFHSVGARLLREYAGRIGLDPAFTIHDRGDSADLMNLVRHELKLSDKTKRFPQKNTCVSIYSAVVNTMAPLEEVLQHRFPWCAEWQDELKQLFLSYVEAKQK